MTAVHQHPHPHLSVCSTCAARLEEAIALYKGDFLAGLNLPDADRFEEWRRLRAENFRGQAIVALKTLIEFHERRRNYDAAQQFLMSYLELEPWDEEAHCSMMRLFVLNNQRSAAIEQFEKMRRLLAEELGVGESALVKRVVALNEEVRRLGARIKQLSVQLARQEADRLIAGAEECNGVRLIIGHYPFFEVDELRIIADRVRERSGSSYAGLLTGAVSGSRLRYVVFVSPGLQSQLPAGKLAKAVGAALGGGGGGRPDIAEGGGAIDQLSAGQEAFRREVSSLPVSG
jgi:tetratricopeptide (TPR) repeat protein